MAHILTYELKINHMFGTKRIIQTENKPNYHKYYKCNRCGYISVLKNAPCPICTKDGFTIKMKINFNQ